MIQATSKVSSKGQIVVPMEIRKILDVKEGDSIKFMVDNNEEIKIEVIKRNSILDLFGSIKAKEDTADFEKIRLEAREERIDQIREKMEK